RGLQANPRLSTRSSSRLAERSSCGARPYRPRAWRCSLSPHPLQASRISPIASASSGRRIARFGPPNVPRRERPAQPRLEELFDIALVLDALKSPSNLRRAREARRVPASELPHAQDGLAIRFAEMLAQEVEVLADDGDDLLLRRTRENGLAAKRGIELAKEPRISEAAAADDDAVDARFAHALQGIVGGEDIAISENRDPERGLELRDALPVRAA